MYRFLRWTVVAFVALAALIVVGPRMLLRTGYGHRTVERVLTLILNERVPGSVTVGGLSGSVITGLQAETLVVRNPAGEVIGRAPYMSARWRPLALLRRRTLDEVTVERPVLVLDRAEWITPPRKRPGSPARETVIERITARNGQLSVKGTTLTHISGTATLRSLSHLGVHEVSGHLGANALTASGVVGWGQRPPWVATRFEVDRPGRLHGVGELFYTRGELQGDIDELTVAAPVATRLVGGRGAVRLSGHLEGDQGTLRTVAHATQDTRALQLHVSVDRERQEAELDARLAGGARPIRLRARARYAPDTLVVSSLHAALGRSRVDGHGELRRRVVRADLHLRLQPSEARLLRLSTAAPIEARLRAEGPTRALAVQGRAQLEAAQVLVDGHVDVPARSVRLQGVARAVQPARVVRAAPAFTVSGGFTLAGRLERRALVGDVAFRDTDVHALGRRITDLTGDAHVRLARNGEATFHWLSGRSGDRRLTAHGQLGWTTGQEIVLRGAEIQVAGAHARGDARYQFEGRRYSVHTDSVSLSPALVARWLRVRPPLPWIGRVDLEGTRDDLTIAAELTTHAGPLRATAHVLRAGGNVDLARLEAQIGESRLSGAAHYQSGRLSASIEELVLSPSLVHQLWPALEPAWPLRLHGSIDGRLQSLELTAALDAGPSTATLRGRIAAREFQLVGHLDVFDVAVLRPTKKHVRGTLELAANGRFEKGGAVGTVALRNARGYMWESPFYRGLADVQLEGRSFRLTQARVEIPGAKLVGHGSGGLEQGFDIQFGVVVTNALKLRQVPQGLRVLVGINSMLPGRSVSGSITQRPGQKVVLHYRVLPIGIAQLEFLFRIITGRVPRFEL